MKKRVLLFISSLMLVVSSIIFTACTSTPNYNISLSPSASYVEVEIGNTKDVIFSIDDYNDKMSNKINIDVDESKIKVTDSEYLGGGRTKITILGLHGGKTTLRATTLEGNKNTSIEVMVSEPLKNIVKKNTMLYAVGGSEENKGQFIPTSDDFSFYPETTLERDLDYFYIDGNESYQFDKILVVDEGDQLRLEFVFNDEITYSFATYNASRIDYVASFHRESDNATISCDSYLYILKEINIDEVKIFKTLDNSKENISKFGLVTNKQEDSFALITVSAPSLSSLIDVEVSTGNDMININPVLENYKSVDEENKCTNFNFIVTTNSINAGESDISFSIKYLGYEIYKVERKVDVKVLVAPKSMTVNGYNQNNSPQYKLYNHNIGSYGKVELYFNVFPSDATVDGIRIEGLKDNNKIKVMYKGMTLTIDEQGNDPVIYDLNFPLQIIGATGVDALGEGRLIFKPLTSLLNEQEMEPYNWDYEVVEGAGSITLSETIYNYNPLNEFSGVFVDLNASESIFSGFKIDNQIPERFQDKINIVPKNDAEDFISVTQGEGLNLILSPKKVGNATFNIVLNNGANVDVTFRIVSTFTQAKIKLTESSKVVNATYTDTSLKTIAIANSGVDGFSGNTAEIQIYESLGGQIGSVSIDASSVKNVYTISAKDVKENIFVIKCLKSGNAEVVFAVKGFEVIDFQLSESILNLQLNIISIISLDELEMYNGENNAHSVDLYYSENSVDLKNDKYLMSVDLQTAFYPSEAFGFMNPVNNNVSYRQIDNSFVYFTVSNEIQVSKRFLDNSGNEYYEICEGINRQMCGGNVYKIGEYGFLDTTLETGKFRFTVSDSYNSNGMINNLRLYANVRQYDNVVSYEMNLRLNPYRAVSGVALYTYTEGIDLDATNTEYYFSCYAKSDKNTEEPTNKKLSAFFLPKQNVPENLIKVELLDYKEGDTEHYFKVTYDAEVLKLAAESTGEIVIVPTSWLDADGNYNGDGACRIKIAVGDGSKEKPLAINDAEKLLKIGEPGNVEALSKHYKITGTIDLNGRKITPIGAYSTGEIIEGTNIERYYVVPFTGSIVGTKEAKIVNVNIDNVILWTTTETDYKYYGGLFADNRGDLANIAFSGHFNFSANQANLFARTDKEDKVYLGIIASINSGSILNCSVTTNAPSQISLLTGNQMQAGMICGLNEISTTVKGSESEIKNIGQIVNLVYPSSSNSTLVNMSHQIVLNSGGNFGGVVGVNNALISTGMHTDSKVYNLSGYTSYVNILSKSTATVGGIAGTNEGPGSVIGYKFDLKRYVGTTTTNIRALSYIAKENGDFYLIESNNLSLENSKFSFGFLVGGVIDSSVLNNPNDNKARFTGGVVGSLKQQGQLLGNTVGDSAIVKSSISRVFVRGFYGYVGLIAGQIQNGNSLTIKNVNVEATEDGSSLNYNSSQLVAYKTVNSETDKTNGNIIPLYNNGEIDASLFEDTQNSMTIEGEEPEKYNHFDRLLFGNGNKFANAEILKSNNVALKSFIDRQESSSPTGLSSYYGDAIIVNVSLAYPNEVYRRYKFNPEATSLEILANEYFQMKQKQEEGEGQSGINVFYAFYYKAVDSTVQNQLNSKNILRITDKDEKGNNLYPFELSDNVFIISESNLVKISEDASLTFTGTGLAKIKIKSSLNATKEQTAYIYITEYVIRSGPTKMYTSAIGDDFALTKDTELRVYKNSPTSIFLSLATPGIYTDGGTFVELEENTDGALDITYHSENYEEGNVENVTNYTSYTKNGMMYTFSKANQLADDAVGTNKVTMQSIFEVTIGTYKYVGTINEESVTIKVSLKKGTSNIGYDYMDFTIMPSTSIDLVADIETDNPSDVFTLRYAQRRDGQEYANNYSVKIEKNSEGIYVANNSNAGIFKITSLSYTNTTNGIRFRLGIRANKYILVNGVDTKVEILGNYILRLISENGYGSEIPINVEVKPERIDNILVNNYTDVNASGTLYPTSDITTPGKQSVMYIQLHPKDADYDYLSIDNNINNSLEGRANAFLTLVKLDENGNYVKVNGYDITNTGIKIPKELIENDMLIVQYRIATDGVYNNVPISFDINAVKGNENVGSFTKTIYTKLAAKVAVSLTDREPQAGGVYYVARGLSYELSLDVYGYSPEQMTIITDNPNVATIEEINGKRYLKITENAISYSDDIGLTFDIISYGTLADGTKGIESRCKICVLEYIVLNNQNTDIFAGQNNSIIKTSVGNKLNFQVKLINGKTIEYNDQIESVRKSVEEFEKILLSGGKLEVSTNLTENNELGTPILDSNGNIATENGKYILKTTNQIFAGLSMQTIYFTINNFSVIPVRVNDAINPSYKFDFEVSFKIINGIYTLMPAGSGGAADNILKSTIILDVNQRSSLKSPIPITSYEQLIAMDEGAYYILLDDIKIPSSTFEPIKTLIGGLDGNSHKITFSGAYNFEAVNIGLFERINTGAIIQNLTLEFTSNTTFYILKEITEFQVGLLAAENNGIITNCDIICKGYSTISVIAYSETQSPSSYFAGIAAINSSTGSITNSRVSVNLYGASNISGIVGINNGIIASSYVRETSIQNIAQNKDNKTAGIAIENSIGAQILTTYISGVSTKSSLIYADSTTKEIKSAPIAAGFVFNNSGDILDCYSNIPITGNTTVAGFVYANGGTIRNTYSTCKLENLNTLNFPFIASNIYNDKEGIISSSYYLVDININVNIGSNEDIKGLTKLDIQGFNPERSGNIFDTFAISKAEKAKGIWFIPTGGTEPDFASANRDSLTFAKGRLELVAPNLISYSSLVLDETRSGIDETTGEMKYYYNVSDSGETIGSKFNPIIITNADEFEQEILFENNLNLNVSYYRIVANLDYTTATSAVSGLSQTILTGDIEGNGMKISGFVLDSNKTLVNAGLFAQIGNGPSQVGSIKNVTLQPKLVSFPNASIVGTLAGTVNSGYVLNVNVDGFTYGGDEGVVVSGKNVVGGVVGRSINNYKVFNINSKISAKANYMPSVNSSNIKDEDITYNHYTNNYNKVSYAGAIAGIFEGEGEAKHLQVSEKIAIIGEKVAFIVGRIGKGSAIDDVTVTMNDAMFMRAHYYGGTVVGELDGELSNVNIIGSNSKISLYRDLPKIPEAVGGVVGVMKSGKLKHVKNNQAFIFNSKISGGVVGISYNAELSEIEQSGDIDFTLDNSRYPSLSGGGIIGYAKEGILSIDQVASNAQNLTLESDGRISVFLAGFIASTANSNLEITLTDSYVSSTLNLIAYNYNTGIQARVSNFIIAYNSENVTDTPTGEDSRTLNLNATRIFSSGKALVTLIDRTNPGTGLEAIGLGIFKDGNTENYYAGYNGEKYVAFKPNDLTPSKFEDVYYLTDNEQSTNGTYSNIVIRSRYVYNTESSGWKGHSLDLFRFGSQVTNYDGFISSSDTSNVFKKSSTFKPHIYYQSNASEYNGQIWKAIEGQIPWLAFEDNFSF